MSKQQSIEPISRRFNRVQKCFPWNGSEKHFFLKFLYDFSQDKEKFNKTAWLAQLGECRFAGQEVTGSNPGRTNTQGLLITEKKVLPL